MKLKLKLTIWKAIRNTDAGGPHCSLHANVEDAVYANITEMSDLLDEEMRDLFWEFIEELEEYLEETIGYNDESWNDNQWMQFHDRVQNYVCDGEIEEGIIELEKYSKFSGILNLDTFRILVQEFKVEI